MNKEKETDKERDDRRKRLKLVRKALNKSVTDFADIIGIQQGSLSDIEGLKKKVGVSRAVRRVLFEKLNVNEAWFLTGIGEMFCSTMQDNLLRTVVNKYHPMSDPKTGSDTPLEVGELKRRLELVSEENSILKDQLIEALRRLGGF